ncbi:hypothetical protein [Kaistia nematophila]|uniref:Uncharacterized protein n=1 Tax=Kaistia nematophila TaxID=2994654 RepID=A0A9X3EFC5_9HYPH|nr:hypothetical protein [Kaistia nematophila]MCX5572185.1 hypothetical protein [Kaistia nematophila]
MNWQVRYALENLAKQTRSTAKHVEGELILIATQDRPDVLAVISAAHEIDQVTAVNYKKQYPALDFLCGYRSTCVWHGNAIQFLEDTGLGWGTFATLSSAALDGNANTASHKVYKFADRLLRQYGRVKEVIRDYDRIHRVSLKSGTSVRIGMIAEYEPTADAVRTLWERFGPIDIVWNINPNGSPSPEAIDAGQELGCEVMKWDRLKEYLRTA